MSNATNSAQQAETVVSGTLSVECAKAIKGWVSSETRTAKAKGKAADLLIAAGVMPDYFYAPKDKAEELIKVNGGVVTRQEMYDELKSDIVAGFEAADRKLMATPAKSLSEEKKARRNYCQQQIGSRMKDLRKAIERAQSGDKAGTPNRTRTPDVRMTSYLNDAIKVAQLLDPKTDDVKFDITAFVSKVKEALVILNGESEESEE